MTNTEKTHNNTKTWILVESIAGSGIIAGTERENIQILSKDNLKNDPSLRFKKGEKIIISTETVLDDVLQRLDDPEKKELISTLKNKVECRRMLSGLFPNFFFKEISIPDLATLELDPNERYFVKPIKGYWGSAAYPLDSNTDRQGLVNEITRQLDIRTNIFSDQVVAKDRLIVEEFIDGEEYAVDMFFNEDGKPIITNICFHPLPKKLEYLHVVYYTSYDVFHKLYDNLFTFFTELNKTLDARNIPIHGEFKLHKGKLTPVELNPLRFGSDGFADLCFHAFGFNPFLCFAQNCAPDWDEVWEGREEKVYAFYLGYNGSDMDVSKYRPDFRNFRKLFSNILADTAMNYQSTLAFSVMYIEENSLDRINELLEVEFNEYFVGLEQYSKKSYMELYRAGAELQLAPGEILWDMNDAGDYLVLTLKGELEVFLPSDEGEIMLGTYGPGTTVGEMSAIDGLPRSASVRAKTHAKVMKISGTNFRKMIHNTPDLLEDLYWQQVNRIRKLNQQLMHKTNCTKVNEQCPDTILSPL